MRFKVVTVGWNCAQFIKWTLDSIESQLCQDFDVWIVDDATEDPRQGEIIREWCDTRDERWNYTINTERLLTVRNQYEAIQRLNPTDEDVIVWLDLDGDRFAHEDVFGVLRRYYDDDTLLTYGSYRPVPDKGTSTMAAPFPGQVIDSNSYRHHIAYVGTCFNHLRTMRGRVFHAIPEQEFKWPGTNRWYEAGTDYIFMTAGLELAGKHHKFIPEVLCLYNHDNPFADYIRIGRLSSACNWDYLMRPQLKPLPEV